MVHLVASAPRAVGRLGIVVVALLLTACARGPEAPQVKEAMQQQLDAALGGPVLKIGSFRTAGGLPLKEPDGRLVYFNAELHLARDYDFTRWDAHSVASLGALLGAGPKGLFGLRAEGNRTGDKLGVYGSAAFAWADGRWVLTPTAPPAPRADAPIPAAAKVSTVQPHPREAAPPSPVQNAIERLGTLTRAPLPGTISAAERESILVSELENAYQSARRRLERRAGLLMLAGGPRGGAYEETMNALAARATRAGVAFEATSTEGSGDNIRHLLDRSAQFAIVQNDIARAAHAGRGRFVGAPQHELRAVASLFPEVVHLVAATKSGVEGIADLRGKRVGLGPEGSGTRANALALLAANGSEQSALAALDAQMLPDAVAALATGRIDALFVTIHAPATALQSVFAQGAATLVPMGPSPQVLESGLVPLTLPARTYSRQDAPVPTLAATALMVTRADVPDVHVDAMLRLLFEERPDGGEPAAPSRIALRSARQGVGIPWHPRAEAYIVARSPAPSPGAPTATGSGKPAEGAVR